MVGEIKTELTKLTAIENKLAMYEYEFKEELPIHIPNHFVCRFINWMKKNYITEVYMQEYIDQDTQERKFEIGARVITGVAVEDKYYEYEAKHVKDKNMNFDGMTREQIINFLQGLEDYSGRIGADINIRIWNKYKKEQD